jgi:hypothetical protein
MFGEENTRIRDIAIIACVLPIVFLAGNLYADIQASKGSYLLNIISQMQIPVPASILGYNWDFKNWGTLDRNFTHHIGVPSYSYCMKVVNDCVFYPLD